MRERKKIIRSVFLCAFVSAFVACSNKADYKDSSLPVETRVQDLLGRMTVEEKAAQLDMLSAKEIVIDENTLSDEQLKHFVDSMCIGAVCIEPYKWQTAVEIPNRCTHIFYSIYCGKCLAR